MKRHVGIIVSSILFCFFCTQIITYNTSIRRTLVRLNPKEYIKSNEKAVLTNKYAQTIAQLRFGNELHPEEYDFLKKRTQKVTHALESLLNRSLQNNKVPRISVVCSGGGCRAMLATLGALSGLQTIGLLDAVTYISSLSGSTWALGLWMSTGMSLDQLKKYVKERLTHNIYKPSTQEISLMGHAFGVKVAFNQPCTVVDIFGGFLANNFLHYFGDDRQMIHLSDQSERIKNADVPFPIYTAVDGRRRVISNAPWYEFTPLEIGSAHYGAYVPAWAYGRSFNAGISTNYAPEQSLGFHFGIFGSAFAFHAGHVWKRYEYKIKNRTIKTLIDKAFQYRILSHQRLFWGNIPNFMFGIKVHDVSKNKQLKLVDAGLECNLPYLPISGERIDRKPDIIIFFDFSKNLVPTALRTVEKYARDRNLPFPTIDYKDIEKRTISVFKNESDPLVPVVIYMPRVSDANLWRNKKQENEYKKYKTLKNFDFQECIAGPCETTNFHYTRHQSQQVMDQMEFNVVANRDVIIDAVRWVVERE